MDRRQWTSFLKVVYLVPARWWTTYTLSLHITLQIPLQRKDWKFVDCNDLSCRETTQIPDGKAGGILHGPDTSQCSWQC